MAGEAQQADSDVCHQPVDGDIFLNCPQQANRDVWQHPMDGERYLICPNPNPHLLLYHHLLQRLPAPYVTPLPVAAPYVTPLPEAAPAYSTPEPNPYASDSAAPAANPPPSIPVSGAMNTAAVNALLALLALALQ